MASRQTTVDFILEQIAQAGTVSAKQMFGEYGLYCNGKMPALICNDQLFVKPTKAGRAYLGTPTEAAPYKGAKPCFLIPGDQCEDSTWLTDLIRLTTAELPAPDKKKKK